MHVSVCRAASWNSILTSATFLFPCLTSCWSSLRVCAEIVADLFFLTLFAICSKCVCEGHVSYTQAVIRDSTVLDTIRNVSCNNGIAFVWVGICVVPSSSEFGLRVAERRPTENTEERCERANEPALHPFTEAYCFLGPSNCMAKLLNMRNKADWLARRFVSQLSLLAASPASNEASGGGALICFS